MELVRGNCLAFPGEAVVKLLPVSDKREVAVAGLMRIEVPLRDGLQAFQRSMALKNKKSVVELGKFSSSPSLADLDQLTMDNRDIEDLKQCEVQNCKVKMSAEMITRFKTEINWNAPDYRIQANRLYRQILLNYVKGYLERGDSALIQYDDKSREVNLAQEQDALLDSTIFLNRFAPEFAQYLKSFPASSDANVKNTITWTKVNFGLKPVTALSHVATYDRRIGDMSQIFVATKQLYANHYFDSSLALTAVISVSKPDSSPDSYLVYLNRSRTDALTGAFGGLKRNIVEGEAISNLTDMFRQTRARLDGASASPSGSSSTDVKETAFDILFGGTRLLWWLMALVTLVAIIGIRARGLSGSTAGLGRGA